MFTWYSRNWYNVGAAIFVILALCMGFWGNGNLDRLTIILVYSFMALLCHQFEEYRLPGGGRAGRLQGAAGSPPGTALQKGLHRAHA
ncbi:MAG: hypothetical protein LBJ08_01910 [Bifidobacteriaceae bacterium]|jgi:hypothetical protein|nr:hypothetical protein [Bifidobacteriaceae bacterium]